MGIPYKPHRYQKKAIKFVVERGCAALFQDPGLGKTSEVYAAYDLLREECAIKRMLVICPLRAAVSTWPDEKDKWSDFSHLRVHVLHGSKKEELLNTPHDVSIINPEGLPWLFQAMKRKKWWWDMLAIDESTGFKNYHTRRHAELRPRIHRFNRRVLMTGSPAPNGLQDLFGQIFLLDQGHALGRWKTQFRNRFFNKSGWGGYTYTIKDGAEKEIYKLLKPLVLRMAAEDYLDLPPLIFNDVKVELDDKSRAIYEQMEQQMIAAIEGELVTANNAGAVSIKCRQLANGGIYLDDEVGGPRRWKHVHMEKAEAVRDLVEEMQGTPALVAYEFKHDLERLRKLFPKAPVLAGGITTAYQREVEAAWNKGKHPVVLAQPKSVKHGLNLQGTRASVIWHSNTWDLEEYEQFIRRVWRQGQKDRVVVHRVIAKDTVDHAILAGIARKDKTQRALLAALKDYAEQKLGRRLQKTRSTRRLTSRSTTRRSTH